MTQRKQILLLPLILSLYSQLALGYVEKEADKILLDALQMRTMSAVFFQTVSNIETGQELSSSSGKIVFSKPDFVKCSYDAPLNQIFIKNGALISVYDKDLMQLSKMSQSIAHGTPFDFLIRDYQIVKSFYKIDKLPDSGTSSIIKITPLDLESDYYQIILEIKETLINKIKIFYRIGRVIEIKFSEIQINLNLDEKEFQLELPSNIAIEEVN